MMDSDYTIQNLIELAITLPDIISCLVGILISLVAREQGDRPSRWFLECVIHNIDKW